jgi:DNA-binding response OmpR family regulator
MTQPRRILIVEDESRIAAFLEKGLRRHGYDTLVVAGGRDALDSLLNDGFDLLLLDLGLPQLDGWDVLNEVRKQDKPIPVIVVTARDSVSDRTRGMQLGVSDYVVKPFRFHELLRRVNHLFGVA